MFLGSVPWEFVESVKQWSFKHLLQNCNATYNLFDVFFGFKKSIWNLKWSIFPQFQDGEIYFISTFLGNVVYKFVKQLKNSDFHIQSL